MKVFITRPIDKKAQEVLEKNNKIELVQNENDRSLSKGELIEQAKGSAAIITLLSDKIDREIIDKLSPDLKIIANYAVGFDNVDVEYAKEKGIVVSNTPEVMTQAVAEHAIALILCAARRIPEGDRYVRAGKYSLWEPNLLIGPEIAGKTIGIVGIGRIGATLAKIAYHGFGMKILYCDLRRDEELERNCQAHHVSLNHLLSESDFVSLHVPLLEETHHMIGEKQFELMKESAILVNTARGAVVDEKALIKALKSKKIFAAGLDVFEEEGEVNKEFYDLENVILTPHIASATHEARESMAECAAENVIEVLSGKPAKTPVN